MLFYRFVCVYSGTLTGLNPEGGLEGEGGTHRNWASMVVSPRLWNVLPHETCLAPFNGHLKHGFKTSVPWARGHNPALLLLSRRCPPSIIIIAPLYCCLGILSYYFICCLLLIMFCWFCIFCCKLPGVRSVNPIINNFGEKNEGSSGSSFMTFWEG